jgi:hypothetical protein
MRSKGIIWLALLFLCFVQSVCAVEYYNNLSVIGGPGWGPGLFQQPQGIAIGNGNIYVTDATTSNISVFDINTGVFQKMYGVIGSGNGEFDHPRGIAYHYDGWTGSDFIYIADLGNSRVQRLNTGTDVFTDIGSGYLDYPAGVAVNYSGYIYVTDLNNKVTIFDRNGNYISQIQAEGSGNGQFMNITGVAIDSEQNVYVVDVGNDRIQKFTPELTYITQWGSNGAGNGQFDQPQDIAVDRDDNLYVTDAYNSRVQKFSKDGTYLAQWGTFGYNPGEFYRPVGIAVDWQGIVSVVDEGNQWVQQFARPVTVSYAGDGHYYAGEDVRFMGINTEGSPTYLFMTGPDLPPEGVQLNLDPGNSSVTDGIPGTFTQTPVDGANKWVYIWNTTEDMPLNITAETYMTEPHSVFTIYAESQPHDASNIASGNYTSATFNMSIPFITATANRSVAEPGGVFSFSGTKMGCVSPDCYVSIFIKNDTFGGSLPLNGTKPDDFSVRPVTGDNATFGQATVEVWNGFEYIWDTSAITGGSLLPDSEYMVVVSMRPMNWPDVSTTHIRGLPYAGYYTKLGIGILGPLHPDYAVNVTTGPKPLAVAFRDLSGGLDDVYINFGDGTEANISSTSPYVHTYTSEGTFTPVIYAINATSTASRTNATITVAPSTGSIIVDSAPGGANITVDDVDIYQKTLYEVLDVTPGYHHVRVDMAGFNTQEKSIYVGGGMNVTADFVLDPAASTPGFINVVSNITGAEIYIDGENTGFTTPYNIGGYLGNHSVKLTYNGYFNSTRPVIVPSGATTDLYITMDPIPAAYSGPVLDDVKRVLKEELDDNTAAKTASSSPDRLDASQTLTLWGVQPPIDTPPAKATVVFIDPTPTANWEHPCSYVFIDETGEKTVVSRMSPSPDLVVSQVAGTATDPAGENLNSIGSRSTPSTGGGLGNLTYLSAACSNANCGDNYAVLIDGGYDAANNHIRYWNDLSFMYQTLNKTYGYPKDHIQVLMSDGPANAGDDRHNWTYPDGSVLMDSSPVSFDENMYGTEVTGVANLVQVTTAFKNIPAGKDLFVFTTGHGGWDPNRPDGGEAFLYLWNKRFIYASDFVNLLPLQDARSISIVMEQCNSGGFVDPFMNAPNPNTQKRMIATASAKDEPSNDNGYSSTWTMAMAKVDADEVQGAWADRPQGAGNNKISIWEASVYAKSNDPYRSLETPQYAATGSDGQSQYLHTCTQVAKTLKLSSPDNGDSWSIGYTRNISWGQTGLDPATPVTLSLRNTSAFTIWTLPVSTGFYNWYIDTNTIKPGSKYTLRITDASDNLYDEKALILLAYATAGRLNVSSVPVQGAFVYLDGLNQSVATRSMTTNVTGIMGIDPGTHMVGVVKSGYQPVSGKYFIKNRNQFNDASFTLSPIGENGAGMMEITSSPVPAEVIVDGVPTGQMTPYSAQYAPGTYTVGVRASGYISPESQPIRIFNKPASAEFMLTPADSHRAVFRGGNASTNWFFDANMDGIVDSQDKFGKAGDIPLVGDLNNDGTMDRGVFRSVTRGSNWFVDYGMDGTTDAQDRFGQVGDIPIVSDFNNDRITDRAVFREVTRGNNWFVDYSMDGSTNAQDRFGQVGDIPLVGDFNNDRITDRAVFREVTRGNNWFVDYNMDGTIDAQDRFGQIGDIPLAGDFNRDGIMDRAVFRSVTRGNNWFVDYSMDGTTDAQDRFGQIGDLPVVWSG